MSNMILMATNAADWGSVVASSTASGFSASNMLSPRRQSVWRSGAVTSAMLDITLTSAVAVSAIVVGDHNVPSGGTIRVQGFTTSMGVGQIYDSGALAPVVWGPRPSHAVFPSAVTARYWRVTLAWASATYLQVGRIYIGAAWSPTVNCDIDWELSLSDMAQTSETRGGQRYSTPSVSRTQYQITLGRLTLSERSDLLTVRHQMGTTVPGWICVAPNGGIEQAASLLYCTFTGSMTITQKTDTIHEASITLEEYL
jgi:hypothetical protein